MNSTRFRISLGVFLALISGVALAADPSAHQIYLATQSGNIAQAEQMVAQVLKDHPSSAKAHFIAAEVEARAGNFGNARRQLAEAQALAPGLPFANARAVSQLQRELGVGGRLGAARTRQGSHLGWALLLIGGVLVAWMIVRRRMAASAAYGAPYAGGMMAGGMGAPPGGYPPGGVAPGYGPGYGPGYAPGGSGLMGNIASGLAIGAGVAAGEALVGRVLEGSSGGGGIIPAAGAAPAFDPQANADLGGTDFGVSDPGSWGDSSGGGGGWDSGADDSGWT